MTSPTSVGQVSVEVVAEARALAKSLKAEVEKAFKGIDVSRAIREATAGAKVNVPVDVDTAGVSEKLRTLKAPTVKVNLNVDRRGVTSLSSALKSLPRAGVGLLTTAFQGLSQAMTQSSSQAVQFGGALGGALVTASGPVGIVAAGFAVLIGGIAGVAAAASVAIPAISALAGAIAALPGLLAGAGAGFGTLALGFSGIADAFKPKAGGGGGGGGGEDPASRARRIAGAERGVEAARRGIAGATRGVESAERSLAEAELRVVEAQRRAAQMQQAINRARVAAKENIDDLTRSLAGARLSEEGAALGVTEALRALNLAKESGVLPDIQRADLEYRQAIQTLDEAKDTTEDLGIEQADAAAKGVEGSDLVQAALADQVEALKAVKAAQTGVIDAQSGLISANDGLTSSYDSLKSAQDSLAEANKKAASAGGAGGALGDVVKLAPAAQRFVNAIKALKPAFEDLRLDVQQKLFAGLDKTVTNLGNAWIPALKRVLGSYATTFNGFFKNLGASLGKPKFIADIETGAEGARKGLEKIGDAISGPLVEAFGRLSAASAPFLEALGDEIGKVVTKFSDWVQAGKESGALQDFFDSATKAMRDIFDIGGSVASIIGSIISIIAGRRRIGTSKSPLESFKEGLEKVAKYLDDPAVQEGIRQFFGDLEDGLIAVGKFIKKIPDWIAKIKALKAAITGEGREVAGQAGAGAGKGLVDLGEAARKAGFTPAAGTATGTGVGASTGDGFLAGLREALGRAFTAIPSLLWSGPDSLIGKIKSGLGIASPSTLTTTMGQELINGLVKGIGDKVEELKNKAAELPGKIREGIGNAKDFLVRKGQDFATGLRSGMSLAKESVKSKAGELRSKVGEAFSKASSFLQGRGQQLADGLRTGMNQVAGNVSITASNLKTRVKNAFSNAGTLLSSTGENLVYGLWNGIASLGRWLRDRVLAFARATIPGPLHKFFGIASPSKLMAELGGHLGTGLALGIESEEARVARAAQALAAAALPDVGAVGFDLSAAGDAAIQRSLQVAGANTLQASWAPGMTGDKILDALKGSIKFSHRGDVVAALGSA